MEAESAGLRIRGQLGETLIESLIALVILSMIVAASYAGLQVAIRASAQHKESAVAETLLRTAAERLQDPDYAYVERAGCAGAGEYMGLPSHAGYEPITASVSFVVPPSPIVFNGFFTPISTPSGAGGCPAKDPGLQLIKLAITTPSGHTEGLELMKRRP